MHGTIFGIHSSNNVNAGVNIFNIENSGVEIATRKMDINGNSNSDYVSALTFECIGGNNDVCIINNGLHFVIFDGTDCTNEIGNTELVCNTFNFKNGFQVVREEVGVYEVYYSAQFTDNKYIILNPILH